MKTINTYFILLSLLFGTSTLLYSQTVRDQQVQQERQNIALPELPQSSTNTSTATTPETPTALNVDSRNVVAQSRVLPNDGVPYFILSGGLAPFQASIGILKYFIPEWWGQLDLNLTFLPTQAGENYFTSARLYQPYVAFRVVTGWAFYNYRIFEISLIAQIQIAFISTDDIPIIPSLGMRFIFGLFFMDLGVSYATGVGSQQELIFSGFFPAITLGFRF